MSKPPLPSHLIFAWQRVSERDRIPGRGLCTAMGNTYACIRQAMGLCCVEERIEKSKVHWSLLSESDPSDEDEQVAEVSNVEVFRTLQSHPTWGQFFVEFNQGEGWPTLEVGKKFAEGGQAELYHARVKWGDPQMNVRQRKTGTEWVLKVFKVGTFLSRLQAQLPRGLLQFHAEVIENRKSSTPKVYPRFYCNVYFGTLLKDGKFAFLMIKEQFDLRNLIDRKMKRRWSKDGGPFSKEDAKSLMYTLALGVNWLHSHDIVHRDLKASNVLVSENKSRYPKRICHVADYECSIGVVGTGFFRAPEILQACKDEKLNERLEVFSKAADIYAYGMICYEILTGKLPFDGHPQSNYNLVLNGQRPMVPHYVEDWTRELLDLCWESNPGGRPTIGEILNLHLANSTTRARDYANFLKRESGGDFTIGYYAEIES